MFDGTLRIKLPTLHADQARAYRTLKPSRRRAVRCGRRWGKTTFGEVVAESGGLHSKITGWFAPDYRRMAEVYNDIFECLAPQIIASSKVEGVIRLPRKGRIDFWTLDDENAGRSRFYDRVVIDEAAFTDDDKMMDIWERSIEPTLLDRGGIAYALSNTNGYNTRNFFWRVCNEPQHGFVEYHAPTRNNPLIPIRKQGETDEEWLARREAEFEALRAKTHPRVWSQEYEAEFVDWRGEAFFALQNLLVDGKPLEVLARCDAIFAIVDTAVKTGKEHDGSAVVYYALIKYPKPMLVMLDWDITQIEGAVLEGWLAGIFARLNELATIVRPRIGSAGVLIEDRTSGSILLQQAQRRSWAARPIESELTAKGKDERAISVSGYVYQGLVKFWRPAFEKTVTYKGQTRNHLEAQVTGYRVGAPKKEGNEDDLLDCFCYGAAVALGNAEGF